MNIEVRPARLPGDSGALLDAWGETYTDWPHWVPPLRFERKSFFNPAKNPYFRTADVQVFLAYRAGRPIGTISAQVDRVFQETNPGVGFFGFFEFPDDPDVSTALFRAATGWLREKGMVEARGPFSFNSNHESGLLVDTFDLDPILLTTYNPPYYIGHYKRLGLEKAMDLLGYWIDSKAEIPERLLRLSERFAERHPNVRIRPVDVKDYKNEVKRFQALYNDAWADNWGFVKLGAEEFDVMAEGLKTMIDPRFCYVAEVDGEPAAVSLTLPDFNQVAKKMDGRIFPYGWYHYLTVPKTIKILRVFILGVARKYQHLALGAPLYQRTWEAAQAAGIEGAEASWILENNHRMRGALEKMGAQVYKTWRVFSIRL